MSELNNYLLDAYEEDEGNEPRGKKGITEAENPTGGEVLQFTKKEDERSRGGEGVIEIRDSVGGKVIQAAAIVLVAGAAYYYAGDEGGPKQAQADEVVCTHNDGILKFDTDKPGCEKEISFMEMYLQGWGFGGKLFSNKDVIYGNGGFVNPPEATVLTIGPDLEPPPGNVEGLKETSFLIKGNPPILCDWEDGSIIFTTSDGQEKGHIPISGLSAYAEGNGRLYIKKEVDQDIYVIVVDIDTIMNSNDGDEVTELTEILVSENANQSYIEAGLAIKDNTLLTAESTGYSTFQLDENGIPIETGSTYVDLGYTKGIDVIIPLDNDDIFLTGGTSTAGARFTIERDDIQYDFVPGSGFPEESIKEVKSLSGGRVLIVFNSPSGNIHIPPYIVQLLPNGEIEAEPAVNYPASATGGEVNYCAVIDPAFATCVSDLCEGVDCSTDTVCVTGECEDGECVYTDNNGAACDDNDNCTTYDVCLDGDCVGLAIDCDDGITCTSDFCEADTGDCGHEPLTGPECNDGDACTEADTCQSGTCTGVPITCDDGVTCTSDFCDVNTGDCKHQTNDGLCPPGPQCTTTACTLNGCETITTSGEPCDDNDPGTENDTCEDGTCVGEVIYVEENPEESPEPNPEEPEVEYDYEVIEEVDVEPYYPDSDPDVVESPEEVIEEVVDAMAETMDSTPDAEEDSGNPKPETTTPDSATNPDATDPEIEQETAEETSTTGEDVAGNGGSNDGGCSVLSAGPGAATPGGTANSTAGRIFLALAAAGIWASTRFRKQPVPVPVRKKTDA